MDRKLKFVFHIFGVSWTISAILTMLFILTSIVTRGAFLGVEANLSTLSLEIVLLVFAFLYNGYILEKLWWEYLEKR